MLLPLLFSQIGSDSFTFDHNFTAAKFRQLYLERGDRMHCQNIPPRTSIVFNVFPKCTFTAAYTSNGTSYSLKSTALTAGFDTGGFFANLTVRAVNSGTVVYFAASFPEQCTTRIVSNRAPHSLEMRNTSTNICYFNGADRDLTFTISVKTHSGSLNSQMIQRPMVGESRVSLDLVDPEVISWTGEMDTVKIEVRGDVSVSQDVFQTLNGMDPLFLETGYYGGIWELLGRPAALVIECSLTVFGLIAMRIYFLRRQMRQRSMKEDEDLPLIHVCDDQPMMQMEYQSVPSLSAPVSAAGVAVEEADEGGGSRLGEIVEAESQSAGSDV
jgi:hypothetical protein